MCDCCNAYNHTNEFGNKSDIPSIYKRWKYSSRNMAIYLTRDTDTGISYMVFNHEEDSGYDLDDDSYECIKLEVHNCPICGRDLDADIPPGVIERNKAELERRRKEAEEKAEIERKEKRYLYFLQLKEEFEPTEG